MLPVNVTEEKLVLARNGNRQAREDLIAAYRTFILGASARVCGRGMDWNRDDELSIGLIAFDEAIDRFDHRRGVPFPAFARLIIKSRILDYLRKQSRHNSLSGGSLDDYEGQGLSSIESSQAWDLYIKHETDREREEEIDRYKKFLHDLGICFDDLVKASPKHRDARATLLNASRLLSGDHQLFSQMMTTGKLPVMALSRLTGINVKTIERGRKYIIATSVIWHFCEDFLYLCSFVKLPGKEARA